MHMTHHTKDKGDIALTKIIADLTEKEYYIFLPISESLPIDLIAYKNNKSYRIQCKYSSSGEIPSKTNWTDKHGTHTKHYDTNDFDYFGIYLPNVSQCIYPAISFKGCTVSTNKPTSASSIYWYEDFLQFTDTVNKKNYKDFNIPFESLIQSNNIGISGPKIGSRKVERPSKEELEKLIWQVPATQIAKQFGVSDSAIIKWCRSYGIGKPTRGYWSK